MIKLVYGRPIGAVHISPRNIRATKSAGSVPNVRDRIDPIVWKIAGVVLLGPLMTSLDSTVVNVSLSTLSKELHAPLTMIQWVTSGYLLALALTLPLSGWLVDRIGAKRVYIFCFTAFTAASLLCGSAGSVTALISFRVIQGMAGGLLAPLAQMMAARGAGQHVARVMGLMAMPVLIGPILGPVLAGTILQHASWRWIFFINLPIGVLAMALAAWILPRDAHEVRPRTLDLKGLVMLSPGLVLLLHSLETMGTSAVATHLSEIELFTALSFLAVFVRHGIGRGELALIDLQLFRNPTFSAAACTQFLSNAVSFGGQMLLPLYLLMGRSESPGETGLLLAPLGLGMLCSYPMMGPLTERLGSRAVSSTGAVVALLGTIPFALFAEQRLPILALCVCLFVRGVGLGSIGIPSIAAAYASIPKQAIPMATTSINIVQRLGGPAATTLLAIFLYSRLRALSTAPLHAFAATFWVLCAIHTLAVCAAFRLPAQRDPSVSPRDFPPIEA